MNIPCNIYTLTFRVESILLLCAVSLAAKIIFLLLLFGKPVRNLKFITGSSITILISSLFFVLLSYIFMNFAPWFIFTMYYLSPYIYLLFVALLYIGGSISIEFPMYYFIVLKERIGKSDLIATLMLINLFGYVFLFELGLILPFAGI